MGGGPNGPDVEQLCDQLEIATEHVSPEGTETDYKHDHLYIETIERYCNSELSITVSLPNAIPFTPSDIVLKHHPRNTNVVTDINIQMVKYRGKSNLSSKSMNENGISISASTETLYGLISKRKLR